MSRYVAVAEIEFETDGEEVEALLLILERVRQRLADGEKGPLALHYHIIKLPKELK